MNNAYTHDERLAAVAPALILGVPLFDMLFVMYVRRRAAFRSCSGARTMSRCG
jgi:hypothetical protein